MVAGLEPGPNSAGGGTEGPVVVVTGASSGIGRELSRQLAADGARLVLVARRADRLQSLADEIRTAGGVAHAITCDLGDAVAVAGLPARVEAVLGPIDVLVNNAGRGSHGAFDAIELATHREVIRTNLDGLLACTYAFLPQLLNSDRAQLVFVSSVLGRLPAPEHAVYAATKWAVSGLGESLSYELAPRGIQVIVVEPGLVQSEFAERASTPLERYRWVPAKTSAAAAAEIRRAMRIGQPHRIADRSIAAIISLKRHLPSLFRWVFGAAYRRARKR